MLDNEERVKPKNPDLNHDKQALSIIKQKKKQIFFLRFTLLNI